MHLPFQALGKLPVLRELYVDRHIREAFLDSADADDPVRDILRTRHIP